MNERYLMCEDDMDYARYSQFFIRHYFDFSKSFTLSDAIMHTLETIAQARIMLILDEHDQVIAWAHYRFIDEAGGADSAGAIAFVDSVIIARAHRSSRLFLRSFRQMLQFMLQDNPNAHNIRFTALADNVYLNRLYSKFAEPLGQREGAHGVEQVYAAKIPNVTSYLQQFG
jgi:hypothetical protein